MNSKIVVRVLFQRIFLNHIFIEIKQQKNKNFNDQQTIKICGNIMSCYYSDDS